MAVGDKPSWSSRAFEVLKELSRLQRRAHHTEDFVIISVPGVLWWEAMALAQGTVPEPRKPGSHEDEQPAP